MATVTDPTFGGGFDGAAFKTAIRNAMLMGSPNQVEMKATFRWKDEKSYSKAGPGGRSYDLTATPMTDTTPVDVVLDTVAVQFVPRTTLSGGTPVGEFDTPRAVITMFTEEYDQVFGCNRVLLGTNTYQVDFWAPPTPLFDVDVFHLHVSAVDEA